MSASSSEGPNGAAVIVPGHSAALANYPHARRVGPLVFLSGCSSRRPDGTHAGVEVGPDGVSLDIRAQTRGVLENLRTVLRACGAELENLVDVTTFLVDMADYPGYNAVWNEYFDAASGPARTTVAVAALPNTRLLIEIKATAWISDPACT